MSQKELQDQQGHNRYQSGKEQIMALVEKYQSFRRQQLQFENEVLSLIDTYAPLHNIEADPERYDKWWVEDISPILVCDSESMVSAELVRKIVYKVMEKCVLIYHYERIQSTFQWLASDRKSRYPFPEAGGHQRKDEYNKVFMMLLGFYPPNLRIRVCPEELYNLMEFVGKPIVEFCRLSGTDEKFAVRANDVFDKWLDLYLVQGNYKRGRSYITLVLCAEVLYGVGCREKYWINKMTNELFTMEDLRTKNDELFKYVGGRRTLKDPWQMLSSIPLDNMDANTIKAVLSAPCQRKGGNLDKSRSKEYALVIQRAVTKIKEVLETSYLCDVVKGVAQERSQVDTRKPNVEVKVISTTVSPGVERDGVVIALHNVRSPQTLAHLMESERSRPFFRSASSGKDRYLGIFGPTGSLFTQGSEKSTYMAMEDRTDSALLCILMADWIQARVLEEIELYNEERGGPNLPSVCTKYSVLQYLLGSPNSSAYMWHNDCYSMNTARLAVSLSNLIGLFRDDQKVDEERDEHAEKDEIEEEAEEEAEEEEEEEAVEVEEEALEEEEEEEDEDEEEGEERAEEFLRQPNAEATLWYNNLKGADKGSHLPTTDETLVTTFTQGEGLEDDNGKGLMQVIWKDGGGVTVAGIKCGNDTIHVQFFFVQSHFKHRVTSAAKKNRDAEGNHVPAIRSVISLRPSMLLCEESLRDMITSLRFTSPRYKVVIKESDKQVINVPDYVLGKGSLQPYEDIEQGSTNYRIVHSIKSLVDRLNKEGRFNFGYKVPCAKRIESITRLFDTYPVHKEAVQEFEMRFRLRQHYIRLAGEAWANISAYDFVQQLAKIQCAVFLNECENPVGLPPRMQVNGEAIYLKRGMLVNKTDVAHMLNLSINNMVSQTWSDNHRTLYGIVVGRWYKNGTEFLDLARAVQRLKQMQESLDEGDVVADGIFEGPSLKVLRVHGTGGAASVAGERASRHDELKRASSATLPVSQQLQKSNQGTMRSGQQNDEERSTEEGDEDGDSDLTDQSNLAMVQVQGREAVLHIFSSIGIPDDLVVYLGAYTTNGYTYQKMYKDQYGESGEVVKTAEVCCMENFHKICDDYNELSVCEKASDGKYYSHTVRPHYEFRHEIFSMTLQDVDWVNWPYKIRLDTKKTTQTLLAPLTVSNPAQAVSLQQENCVASRTDFIKAWIESGTWKQYLESSATEDEVQPEDEDDFFERVFMAADQFAQDLVGMETSSRSDNSESNQEEEDNSVQGERLSREAIVSVMDEVELDSAGLKTLLAVMQTAGSLRCLGVSCIELDGEILAKPLDGEGIKFPGRVININEDLEWLQTHMSEESMVALGYSARRLPSAMCNRNEDVIAVVSRDSHTNRLNKLISPFIEPEGVVIMKEFQAFIQEDSKRNQSAIQVFADMIFGSLVARHSGRMVKFLEYSQYMQHSCHLPSLGELPDFLQFFSHSGRSMADWMSSQHSSSVEYNLRTKKYSSTLFYGTLGICFQDAVEQASNMSKSGVAETNLARLLRQVCLEQAERDKMTREEAVAVLTDTVQSCYDQGSNGSGANFLCHVALADVEGVIEFPFGMPRQVPMGFGGTTGAKQIKVMVSEYDWKNSWIEQEGEGLQDLWEPIPRRKRKRGNHQSEFEDQVDPHQLIELPWKLKCKWLYQFVIQERHDQDLLVWLGLYWDNCDKVLRHLSTHAAFCLTDAEHILCKIYIARARVLPARVISLQRKLQAVHCWPLEGYDLVGKEMLKHLEIQMKRVRLFWRRYGNETKTILVPYFQDTREE